MGIGDELMACGRAKATGKRCHILGKDGKPRRHHIWDGVPFIVQAGEGEADHAFQDCGWHRPYIDYSRSTKQKWHHVPYGPTPGVLALNDEELDYGKAYKDFFICEPRIKAQASPNKQWGAKKWAGLKRELARRNMPALFFGEDLSPPSFKHAAAVLKFARGCVLPEGGLHHAAAAVGAKNVIVLMGHANGPAVTGYDGHTNIYANEIGCGYRVPCPECKAFWDALTPQAVAEILCKIIEG